MFAGVRQLTHFVVKETELVVVPRRIRLLEMQLKMINQNFRLPKAIQPGYAKFQQGLQCKPLFGRHPILAWRIEFWWLRKTQGCEKKNLAERVLRSEEHT